jgi:hypothetical protein
MNKQEPDPFKKDPPAQRIEALAKRLAILIQDEVIELTYDLFLETGRKLFEEVLEQKMGPDFTIMMEKRSKQRRAAKEVRT